MKTRVVVVGTGLISTLKHLPAYSRLKEMAEVVALCDVDADKARSVAQRFGIPKTYASLEEALSKENVELVDICTPPRTHCSLAVQALHGGSNVLIEKPMAVSVEECDQIIDAANSTGKQICLGHSDLFYPSFLRARRLVEEGAIGPIQGMRIFLMTPVDYITSKPDHWAHRLPGGVVGETGPHVIYMTLPFINPIARVVANGQKLLPEYPWSPFEDYRIDLIGEKATSSITLTYTTLHWSALVDLWGPNGLIRADLESQSVVLYRRESLNPWTVARSALSESFQLLQSTISTGVHYVQGRVSKTHDLLIRQYVSNIQRGKPAPVPAAEGRESVRVLGLVADQLRGNGA